MGRARFRGPPDRQGSDEAGCAGGGDELPRRGRVRQRTCNEARAAVERNVYVPKRRGQCISGCFAHGLLAGPQAKKRLAAGIRCQRRDLGALALREKLARESVRVDLPVLALDIDTDSRSILGARGDRDQCGVACMRDVEINCMFAVDLGTSANTAPQSNRGRIEFESTTKQRSQRRATCNPAITQNRSSKAPGARELRG